MSGQEQTQEAKTTVKLMERINGFDFSRCSGYVIETFQCKHTHKIQMMRLWEVLDFWCLILVDNEFLL